LSEFDAHNVQADFIFLDPPYGERDAYRETLDALADSNLAKHALVITEHEKRFDPGERFGILQRSRKLEQGDAALSFYRT
jgi:16S rRNA G966 N2-methylase RsmD